MRKPWSKPWIAAVGGGLVAAVCMGDVAHAQDFFSSFFGGFSRRMERSYMRMPFAAEGQDDFDQSYARPRRGDAARSFGGATQAYCVRTCDGRYFPLTAQGDQSKASTCNSFCPSSETKVYYGSSIDNAATEAGKRYGDLPNAFKYRTELVAGCTCNGNATGLAPVKIEDDPTLKRGDIVAGADGLMVSRGPDKRGAMNFSPVPESIRQKYSQARAAED